MDNSDVIQVDIFGLSLSSSIQGGGYAIILKEIGGDRRLPIIIGQSEAQAIAFELEGLKPPRPLTHDLVKNIVETLGYAISAITITELRDSTFYARIRFDDSALEDLDARPSDAIALALKFSAPIYVTSGIMEEVGFVPENEEQISFKEEGALEGEDIADQEEKEEEKLPENPQERKLKQLKSELDEALAKEDYEKAAELRDEIKKIDLTNYN